jgi:hypothetical protein
MSSAKSTQQIVEFLIKDLKDGDKGDNSKREWELVSGQR